MLDKDLALLYNVKPIRLREQVKGDPLSSCVIINCNYGDIDCFNYSLFKEEG